jgi:hypothetical protein
MENNHPISYPTWHQLQNGINLFTTPLSTSCISTHAYEPNHGQDKSLLHPKTAETMETLPLLMPSISISPSPSYFISLPLSSLQQSATYLQNCTYHKVLRSAANKSVLIRVSNEIESPLN